MRSVLVRVALEAPPKSLNHSYFVTKRKTKDGREFHGLSEDAGVKMWKRYAAAMLHEAGLREVTWSTAFIVLLSDLHTGTPKLITKGPRVGQYKSSPLDIDANEKALLDVAASCLGVSDYHAGSMGLVKHFADVESQADRVEVVVAAKELSSKSTREWHEEFNRFADWWWSRMTYDLGQWLDEGRPIRLVG